MLEQFNIPRYYRLYHDVNFRQIYNFSRIVHSYLNSNQMNSKDYSTIVKNFALQQQQQQLPTIISAA